MVMTFRSTIPERLVLLETTPDGRERICVAEREGHDSNHTYGAPRYSIELTHPNGEIWRERHYANKLEIVARMASLMEDKRHQFRAAGHNNDQPFYRPNLVAPTAASDLMVKPKA